MNVISLRRGASLSLPIRLWQPRASASAPRVRLAVDSLFVHAHSLPLEPALLPAAGDYDGVFRLEAAQTLQLTVGKSYDVTLAYTASADTQIGQPFRLMVIS